MFFGINNSVKIPNEVTRNQVASLGNYWVFFVVV